MFSKMFVKRSVELTSKMLHASGARPEDLRSLNDSVFVREELLDLSDHPGKSCAEADAIARRQLKQVEQRLARLEALRTELKRMVHECSGGQTSDCRVLEVLRDHSECLTDHEEIGA